MFFASTPDEVDQAFVDGGGPAYRGKQVRRWVYGKLVADPLKMTDLPALERQRLQGAVEFATATVATHQTSDDGTHKLLLKWPQGGSAETVMIPDADRRTACVSSQVGCPVGCKFCASGINGVKGNLSPGQIVEQIFVLNTILAGAVGDPAAPSSVDGVVDPVFVGRIGDPATASKAGAATASATPPTVSSRQRITNVVFMGMGEPLANYANVLAAVRILHDPQCFNLGARRITISTVGVPNRMRQLADEELPINLALSLHAPNEALRKQLIPWANHFALDDILAAAKYYFEHTGREVTLEYILLSHVNDQPVHARQLVEICRQLRANVNLIRYNEVEGLEFRRPHNADVVAFQEILRAAGINAHVRKSRGRDIDAACGQLRRREEGIQPGDAENAEEKMEAGA